MLRKSIKVIQLPGYGETSFSIPVKHSAIASPISSAPDVSEVFALWLQHNRHPLDSSIDGRASSKLPITRLC